jgi:lysine-N-methylase
MPMLKKSAEMLQPQYMAAFQCAGPDCEEHCCQTWRIPVDKKTYQNYRRCPDKELRAQLDKVICRNRSLASEQNYAKIRLESNGACPFLDSEKLCVLQRSLGEDYLSSTCYNYPRYYRTVSGMIERALTMSCPPAARLVLLDPKPMEFETTTGNDFRDEAVSLQFEPTAIKYNNKAEHFFWPLRFFIISLLQNRAYSLWQRLVMLGFFCHTVQNAQPYEIPSIIARYTKAVNEGAFRDELESIPARYDIQSALINELIKYRLNTSGISAKFLEVVDKMKEALGFEEDLNEAAMANYEQTYSNYYRPFMDEREYILENYLVNFVFMKIFPFNEKGVFNSYVMLVIHYAMIKTLLIGLAAFYKEDFSTEHILEGIYSFSRTIEHQEGYLKDVFNIFVAQKLDNLPYMAILLRN